MLLHGAFGPEPTERCRELLLGPWAMCFAQRHLDAQTDTEEDLPPWATALGVSPLDSTQLRTAARSSERNGYRKRFRSRSVAFSLRKTL